MYKELSDVMHLIHDGYNYEVVSVTKPDYENELEITEIYISVENPNYRPDDGSDPNIVIKL